MQKACCRRILLSLSGSQLRSNLHQRSVPMMGKFADISASMKARSRSEVFLASAVITVLIGYVDYLTGFELRIDVFYLIPISLVVWYVSREMAFFTSLLSGIFIFMSDLLSKPVHTVRVIDIWNIIVVLFFFIIFTLALSRLRVALDDQKQLSLELRNALADSKKANESLEAFSYSVSHDLKGPLWHVAGFAEILDEKYADKLDETAKKYVHRIISNIHRMGNYVDALLKLSRYQAGDLVRSKFNLTMMIRTLLEENEDISCSRNAEILVADDMSANGDTALIQVVLHNLLDNAWKFTRHRSRARIEFGAAEIDGETVYFIRDNGAGFSMEHAKRLFSPFKRFHADSAFPGYGIGLATVQRIIHYHGGRIWAESELNAGTTFYFTFG
jgi:signal transduction histidine kinase